MIPRRPGAVTAKRGCHGGGGNRTEGNKVNEGVEGIVHGRNGMARKGRADLRTSDRPATGVDARAGAIDLPTDVCDSVSVFSVLSVVKSLFQPPAPPTVDPASTTQHRSRRRF